MTHKIYETDSYCKEFTAIVLSCEKIEDGYAVELDKTAFFPVGGGQAADCGTIDGANVLDVQLKDGVVIHTVDVEIPEGSKATCKLDWELRFSRMQSHSGEHVVSGIVHNMFGYQNVGFHMSEALMTVDFDGLLTAEEVARVELLANQVIYKNVEITVSFPEKHELETLEFRSKLELSDNVRIVNIEGTDSCACCAPHVARTGEIGLIKIVNFYPYKKGTRVEMLAGINALHDYCALNAANKELMGLLSASRNGVSDAVIRQNDQLNALRIENAQMSKRLALSELNPVKVGSSAYSVTENLSYDELRHCANSLTDSGIKTCVLLSKADGGYIYVVASKVRDVREIVKELNEKFQGKGGGKPDYAQGKIADEIDKKVVEEMLKK